MADEPDEPERAENVLIQRLMRETNVSEAQAIAFIGYAWPSLLREAKLLQKKR